MKTLRKPDQPFRATFCSSISSAIPAWARLNRDSNSAREKPRFSPDAYAVGIDVLIYSLTH